MDSKYEDYLELFENIRFDNKSEDEEDTDPNEELDRNKNATEDGVETVDSEISEQLMKRMVAFMDDDSATAT